MARLKPIACIVLALFIAAAPVASAQDNLRLAEQDIKAGLLYNFLRYTEWPARATSGHEVVCIYGADPFDGRLAPMAGRTVNQRIIDVRTVRTHDEIDACSLLFVSAQERGSWPQLRSYLAQRNVLTVSDFEGFAHAGGMIEFTRINSRVGVRINIDAVESANLAVQDRLLRLASTVRAGTP